MDLEVDVLFCCMFGRIHSWQLLLDCVSLSTFQTWHFHFWLTKQPKFTILWFIRNSSDQGQIDWCFKKRKAVPFFRRQKYHCPHPFSKNLRCTFTLFSKILCIENVSLNIMVNLGCFLTVLWGQIAHIIRYFKYFLGVELGLEGTLAHVLMHTQIDTYFSKSVQKSMSLQISHPTLPPFQAMVVTFPYQPLAPAEDVSCRGRLWSVWAVPQKPFWEDLDVNSEVLALPTISLSIFGYLPFITMFSDDVYWSKSSVRPCTVGPRLSPYCISPPPPVLRGIIPPSVAKPQWKTCSYPFSFPGGKEI